MSDVIALTMSIKQTGASEVHEMFVENLCEELDNWHVDEKALFAKVWALPIPSRMALISEMRNICDQLEAETRRRGVKGYNAYKDITINGVDVSHRIITFFRNVLKDTVVAEVSEGDGGYSFAPTGVVSLTDFVTESISQCVNTVRGYKRVEELIQEGKEIDDFLFRILDIPAKEYTVEMLLPEVLNYAFACFDDFMTKVVLRGVLTANERLASMEDLMREYMSVLLTLGAFKVPMEMIQSHVRYAEMLAKWNSVLSPVREVSAVDVFARVTLLSERDGAPELPVSKRTLHWLADLVNMPDSVRLKLLSEASKRLKVMWRVTEDGLLQISTSARSGSLPDADVTKEQVYEVFDKLSDCQHLTYAQMRHSWKLEWVTR